MTNPPTIPAPSGNETPSHRDLITRGGGPSRVAEAIGEDREKVKKWSAADSIPGPYWQAMQDGGIATLDELATAADRRRAQDAAAA